ncbi:MAG: PP2C family protein-serine/threonine phosphatase [bacterium]
MTLSKPFVISVVLGILGAGVFFSLFEKYSPQASLDLQLSRPQVIEHARGVLGQMGYDASRLSADANFQFDSGIALYLEEELGMVQAHRVLRADSLSTHNWYVYFYDRSLPPSQMADQYDVWLSPTGHVLGFQHRLPDSVAIHSIDKDSAQALAKSFLQDQGIDVQRYSIENSTAYQRSHRTDYFFRWTSQDSVFGMAATTWVKVQGNKIGGFHDSLKEPEAFRQAGSKIQTFVTFIVTASSIATFVLVIFVIALFLKKYHEGEVGISTAIGIFAFLFGLILVEQLLRFTTIGFGTTIGDVNRFNVRIIVFVITVFIVQAFLAAMVFAAWSVGESSARRGWNQVLRAIDGLHQGKPFTLEFANAVVRGYSFGFVILGIVYGATALISKMTNFGVFTLPALSGIPESFFPSLSATFLGLRIAVLNEIVFHLFFISWLRERTKKLWPGIVISSLLWSLVAFTLWDFPLGYISFKWLFPAYFLLSVFLGLILVKCDLLTAIFTNFVVLALSYAVPMLVSSSSFFETQTVLFYSFMSIPLVMAAIGFYKKQKFEFSLELTPAHIRRITERERMSKELEIARTVQMSLLPKENPLVEGYDVAGICIPALEVGGDYYDFFQLSSGKFGIAIGDVSGKGVPAAIYMTLTKGILQSYAGEADSPKEVLNKLNKQMYKNIEKNSFVSMFYAVIDMRRHTIRFARAGHNPAILAQRGNDVNRFLEPKGMAVGLEAGEKFHAFLEERDLQLQSGDVLTFYTDGFTEANRGNGDEYGEERLLQVISCNKNLSASEIIERVVKSVKEFVGGESQHDDMTMVVVKVL